MRDPIFTIRYCTSKKISFSNFKHEDLGCNGLSDNHVGANLEQEQLLGGF